MDVRFAKKERRIKARILTEDEVVVLDLGVPDLLVHRVTRVVHVNKESGLGEGLVDLLGILVVGGGNGHDGDLAGRQPEGPKIQEQKGKEGGKFDWNLTNGNQMGRKPHHLPA